MTVEGDHDKCQLVIGPCMRVGPDFTIGRRRINLWIDTARVLDTVTYQGGSGLLRRFGVAASVKHDLCNGPRAYKRLRSSRLAKAVIEGFDSDGLKETRHCAL